MRTSLFNLPPMDPHLTWKVLTKFPDGHQRLLLREIACAFQTAEQKLHWVETDGHLCPLCGAADTKPHKWLECPALEQVRDRHGEAVQTLSEDFPGWIDWPVIFMNTDRSFLPVLNHMIPEITWDDHELDVLHNLQDTQTLQFFTDGSSVHQEEPSTRYSGFAIIVDLADSQSERWHQVQEWFSSGDMPSTLVPLLKSRLSGPQGIHPAELSAIVLIIEQFPRCSIWTDSQVAISAFEVGSTARSIHDFVDHPHFPLVLRIFHAFSGEQAVHKIKAHQQPHPTMPFDTVYKILGNQLADEEAKTAAYLLPQLSQESDTLFEQVTHQSLALQKVYTYVLDLQMTLAKAQTMVPGSRLNPVLQIPAQNPMQVLQEWQPHPSCSFDTEVDDTALQHCAWGWQTAAAMVRFLRGCRWPTDVLAADSSPGLSWWEVAMGVILELGTFLPVRRKTSDGVTMSIWISSYQDACRFQVTMAEQSETVSHLYRQVQGLVPQTLAPSVVRGRVKSMYMLGEMSQNTGLSHRPFYQRQRQVVEHLHRFVHEGRRLPDLGGNVPQWECDQRRTLEPWDERCRLARVAVRKVKNRR
eukprot:Skav216409  [mRNA]  locus=scaffold457:478079:479827:+ [translate_table: standard]